MDELWLPIEESKGYYEISSIGRVRSLPRNTTSGKIMKQWQQCGYLRVCLTIDGKRKQPLVHLLVINAFIGPKNKGQQCAHLNGNNKDNCVSNLCWSTPKENTDHKNLHGTMVRGEDNYNAIMDNDKVKELRARYKKGESPKSLFEEYGISRGCGQNIIYGRNWRHV